MNTYGKSNTIIKRILHGFNTKLVENRNSLSLFKQSFYLQFYMYVFSLLLVFGSIRKQQSLYTFDKSFQVTPYEHILG